MSDAAQVQTILLITGPVQGGKTTFLTELIELLKERELRVAGFLCPGRFVAGKRSGFDLKNIGSGIELPMASNLEVSTWVKYRRFWFNPDAFKKGFEWIRSSLVQEPDLVVIDEVGPMELEGLGWSELLKSLVISPIPVLLWSVRENLLGEVMHKWDISPEHLIGIDKMEVAQAADLISRIIKTYRESTQNQ